MLRPGDIVVSNNGSCISKIIRKVTRSNWSHVGIATSKDKILEATKEQDKSDVRESPLDEFLEVNAEVLILVGSLRFRMSRLFD